MRLDMRPLANTLILFLFVSCAGYHLRQNENPFYDYNVRSIAVPMFINQTPMANITGPMTERLTNVLLDYRGLKVYPGESQADAVLVGIITSNEHQHQLLQNTSRTFTSGGLEDTVKPRRPFYVPSTIAYVIKLRLVLIKNPTAQEIDLLKSAEGMTVSDARIIFDQELNLSGSYALKINDTVNGPDSGGPTNFTRNKRAFDKSIQGLADSAAENFRQLVMNVF
jgi:hypothetical protein